MTREEAKSIVRGITDKIEATTDIDDWAEFWGFTRDDYEEFLEMPIKLLEQEPKFLAKSDGTIEQIINCNDCLFKKEWEKIGKLLSNILEKHTEQEPCEDAISRQAVLDAIDVKAWEFCDYLISKNRNDEQKPVSHFADNLRECVREELPSVTPQPKTGRWWERDTYPQESRSWDCSECQEIVFEKTNYCPNCGAKMQEVDNGDK